MLLLILLIPLAAYMGRAFWKWGRTPEQRAHGWRAGSGLLSFGLATTSLLMFWYTGIRAHVHGGFPYYAPLLLKLMGTGFGLGILGLMFGLVSKGRLRWPAVFSSFIMATLWVIVAAGE